VKVREVTGDATHPCCHFRRTAARQHPVDEEEKFARPVEFARQEFGLDTLAKVALDRPAGKPRERSTDQRADAVVRTQLDDLPSIQSHKTAHALSLGNVVGVHNVPERPITDGTEGDQHQRRIGDDLPFLLDREMRHPDFLGVGFVRELGKVDTGDAADVLKSLQREFPAREHALHTGLAETETCGDCGVRDAPPLQDPLQRIDERERAHRSLPRHPRKRGVTAIEPRRASPRSSGRSAECGLKALADPF
jgi:hypothetical protein